MLVDGKAESRPHILDPMHQHNGRRESLFAALENLQYLKCRPPVTNHGKRKKLG